MKVVITGANSAVGQSILRCGSEAGATNTFVAAVRSERAAEEVRQLIGTGNSIVRISYDEPASLSAAFQGSSAVIHLAGILIERAGSTYEQSNVATTRSVVDAAKQSQIEKIVLISAIGAKDTSSNRYYRTKEQAEALVRASGLSYTILRVPLLLGQGTEGAAALKRNVARPKVMLIGGGRNYQQPLYVDDLARAAIAATQSSVANNRMLELVGPTALSERELVERAAKLLRRHVTVRSIPKWLLSVILAVRERLAGPGFSRDALEVITADTKLDPTPAATEIGITLTGIDEMIQNSLG
jgi:uncharacterized protein YbjT (DUF2867 family)